MLCNLVVLIQSFLSGSKQNETVRTEIYDRFSSGEINLQENLFKLTVVNLLPEFLELVAKPRMRLLSTSVDPATNKPVDVYTEIPLSMCPADKVDSVIKTL